MFRTSLLKQVYAKSKNREQNYGYSKKNLSLSLYSPSTIVRNWRNFTPAHNSTDCFLQRACRPQSFVIVMSSLRWVHNRSELHYLCEVAFLCRSGIPSYSSLWMWVTRIPTLAGFILHKVVYVRTFAMATQ